WIDARYPLTRGRTSTESTASSRAVYSSHSVTSRAIGWTTFTFGGGGAGAGRAPQEERTSTAARDVHLAPRTRRCIDRVGSCFGILVEPPWGARAEGWAVSKPHARTAGT